MTKIHTEYKARPVPKKIILLVVFTEKLQREVVFYQSYRFNFWKFQQQKFSELLILILIFDWFLCYEKFITLRGQRKKAVWMDRRQKNPVRKSPVIIFSMILKITLHKNVRIRDFSGPYFYVFLYSLRSTIINFCQSFNQGKVWETKLVLVLSY